MKKDKQIPASRRIIMPRIVKTDQGQDLEMHLGGRCYLRMPDGSLRRAKLEPSKDGIKA